MNADETVPDRLTEPIIGRALTVFNALGAGFLGEAYDNVVTPRREKRPMPSPSRPSGLNHLVINVRNMEETHRFWTEMIGFQKVGQFTSGDPSRLQRKMQFYSGDHGEGRLTHHDIAFCEVPALPAPAADGTLVSAIGHIAIAFPDREAWLRQLAYLQASGVPFERRVEHGMTHSLYIRDPNGTPLSCSTSCRGRFGKMTLTPPSITT